MIHLAVDHGKKVAHAVALSDAGEVLFDEQIASTREGFASIKDALPPGEPVQSIVEAAWNWGKYFWPCCIGFFMLHLRDEEL